MKPRRRSPEINRSNYVSMTSEITKISDLLRTIAQELDNSQQKTISIPSQIGPFFEIDGQKLCICILDHARMTAAQVSNNILSNLSRRQREIVMELAEGHSAKTIGEHLGIHPRTVEAHIHRIYQKTGTHGIAQLMEVVFARL